MSLIGPVIGGYLADPTKSLPAIFSPGSVWETYPYLLPNLVVVLFIMLSGLLGFLFLDESHPKFRNRLDKGRILSQWANRCFRTIFKLPDAGGYTSLAAEEAGTPLTDGSTTRGSPTIGSQDLEAPSPSQSSPTQNTLKTSAYTMQVILQVLAVSMLAFHKVSSDAIIPTFLATPSNPEPSQGIQRSSWFKFSTGFGMPISNISNVLLAQAVVAIISQALIVSKVVEKYGPLMTFRMAMLMFPWLYFLTPFTARFSRPYSTLLILLDLCIKGVLVNLGYVASAIL